MLPFMKHAESGMRPMEEYLAQNPRKGHVVDIFGSYFKRVVQAEGSWQEDKLNFYQCLHNWKKSKKSFRSVKILQNEQVHV